MGVAVAVECDERAMLPVVALTFQFHRQKDSVLFSRLPKWICQVSVDELDCAVAVGCHCACQC